MPVVVDTAGALLYVIMHNGQFQFGSVGHCINNNHHKRNRGERGRTKILNNGCKEYSPTEWKQYGGIRSHGSGEIFRVFGKLGMVKKYNGMMIIILILDGRGKEMGKVAGPFSHTAYERNTSYYTYNTHILFFFIIFS